MSPTPRGGYLSDTKNPGDLAVSNQDLTFSVSAGIESGLVDIKANAKGKTNATQGGGAGKGSDAEDSGGGVGIGVSFDSSWTSPNASGPADSPAAGNVGNPTAVSRPAGSLGRGRIGAATAYSAVRLRPRPASSSVRAADSECPVWPGGHTREAFAGRRRCAARSCAGRNCRRLRSGCSASAVPGRIIGEAHALPWPN